MTAGILDDGLAFLGTEELRFLTPVHIGDTLHGKTTRGTAVHVNPFLYRAKAGLAIGLMEPHQFVGYTGGVKCASIGLVGARTIEANHSLLPDPQGVVGEIQTNPVRQDIEEVGKLMGVHSVINVVLDEANHIVKAFAGEPVTVEKAGSAFCRTVYEIKVTADYDVVIASPGGYPKDMNLYQAQKGLVYATPVVRQGGVLVLPAECSDGHGEETSYETISRGEAPLSVSPRSESASCPRRILARRRFGLESHQYGEICDLFHERNLIGHWSGVELN